VLLALLCTAVCGWAAPVGFTLEEHLGYGWASDVVHRAVDCPAGTLFPGKTALAIDGQPVPSQLARVLTHPDGSLRSAEVWFRTDLPAKGKRVCELRHVEPGAVPAATDLRLVSAGAGLELANARTAVRLPAGTWATPADALSAVTDISASASRRRLPALLFVIDGFLL